MGRDLVMEMVAHAPQSFTITPRNLDRAITIGGANMVFGNVSSPPNCSDLDRGRRPGTRESYRDFIKRKMRQIREQLPNKVPRR